MNDRAFFQGQDAVWWPVAGRSMWPLTAPMEVCLRPLVQPTAMGTVVAVLALDARHAPQVVLHRVVGIDQEELILQGDTTGKPDAPVPWSAVVGELAAVRLGRLVLPWPAGPGAGARHWRRAGLFWLRLAPQLRQALRQAVRKVATSKT
jgi:hypothetical protein